MYGRNPYQQARATTASPGDLVVMLYDGILKFCDVAAHAIESSDPVSSGNATNRALAIIDYLQTILDPGPAPELVGRLDGLYTFWHRQIANANATRDSKLIRDIRPHILSLRDAWNEAKSFVAKEEHAQGMAR